jgi:hypothetical protein
MKNLSIVIPSIGRYSLQDCLQSVNQVLPSSEVIVVGPKKIRDIVEQFHAIFIEEPPSFYRMSEIFHIGFSAATKKYIAWLNDDTELLQFPAGFEPAPDIIYALGVTNDKAKDKPEYFCRHHLVPYCDFGLFAKELGQHFGWWSEEYKFYAADVGFVCKFWLYANGLKNLKGSLVYHSPCEDELKQKIKKLLTEDLGIFYNKWGPVADKLQNKVKKWIE